MEGVNLGKGRLVATPEEEVGGGVGLVIPLEVKVGAVLLREGVVLRERGEEALEG